jgi:hypothetical protein
MRLGALTLLKTSTDKTGNLFYNLKEQTLLNYITFWPSFLLPLIYKNTKLSVQPCFVTAMAGVALGGATQ